ncbi:CYTH-like domain [Trinorchestia longiramus]|nr:CYTH-like domain [Trinorchestia longiramus]
MTATANPRRNVEIKAKIHDFDHFLLLAKDVSGSNASVLEQSDVFFNVSKGRLKLRTKIEGGKVNEELIYYDRPDELGPKTSNFYMVNITLVCNTIPCFS